MRQLAYLGVAALTAVALLGTSCSSDDNDGGNNTVGGAVATGGAPGTSTGGKSSTTTTGTKAGTGGATSTATTANTGTGGATGVGGVTGAGGANVGGVTGAGGNTGAGGTAATGGGSSVPVTGGIDINDGFLQVGTYQGATWTAKDSGGSSISIAPSELCVTGTAIQVPKLDGGGYDYSGAWGVNFGFNLNQAAPADGGDAGPQNPADLSDIESVTVGLNGATGLSLRVQLEVKPDADSGATQSAYYCATLPTNVASSTIDLATLKTNCWESGGTNFDPLTMQPVSFAIAVVTSDKKAYPFNFCVTDLKFNTNQ